MATEEQKKANMMRLMTLMVGGMAKALYDLFGETAYATMAEVGKSLLTIMEDEMGLELDNDNPEAVIMEIGRIFSDEMGFVADFTVKTDGDEITLLVDRCAGWNLTQSIVKLGVDVPFTCPIMNVGQAALLKMGKHARKQIVPREEVRGSAITFSLID
ncbi:MAG: hypothetical protein ABFR97_07410 [Thermodesulfobacteriota bacterium]